MSAVKMVVVDGVRYRPEHAPSQGDVKAEKPVKNKGRKPADKSGSEPAEKPVKK